jgi:hypothetical protein
MATNFNFTESGYVPNNDFNFGFSLKVYKILAGSSKNFTSVWADPNANIETANMYVGTAGPGAALSVIDIGHTTLIDSYKIDKEGTHGEPLDREEIVDINVNTQG